MTKYRQMLEARLDSLDQFLARTRGDKSWRKWLSRRSQRAWEGMLRVFVRYPLPQPRIRPSAIT